MTDHGDGGRKISLAVLPVASTALLTDPVFAHPGGDAELQFEFERDGLSWRGGLRFAQVRAFRFRAESHCTPWHVAGVYDTLAEVSGSSWVEELRRAEPSGTGGRWTIRHFMIYLDSAGCYEVAAAAWSWRPETTGP